MIFMVLFAVTGIGASAWGQSGEWIHDVPDGTVLGPGESIVVTLSVAFEGGGAPFAAFGASVHDTLNTLGADLGGIDGWTVLSDLDELPGDMTTTDGDSLFGTYAVQINVFGPFNSDNPIDVIEFTWTAGEGSGEVAFETADSFLGLYVGEDKESARGINDVPTEETSFGWIVVSCAADVNGDGLLNVLDFIAFQQAFLSQNPIADCDGNGAFNALDFVCFQGVFVAGCP
jgi:hypothetical protein